LREADLSETILSGANLSEAFLRGAILSGANLRGVNLSGADLRGAILSGADLSGADVENAIFIDAAGITSEQEQDLIQRGAIFEDNSNNCSKALV
jgi:uncharacterized protein YjbI with pentapeptide repeats